MECANCHNTFVKQGKSFRRVSLVKDDRSPGTLKDVLDIKVTPQHAAAKTTFLCLECDKLLKLAKTGLEAKKKLFSRTGHVSYIGGKRKSAAEITHSTPSKLARTSASPLKKPKKISSGAKLLMNYKYKSGFRHFLKQSTARKALIDVIQKQTLRELKILLKSQDLPLLAKVSAEAFESMSLGQIVQAVEKQVPFLYAVMNTAFSQNRNNSIPTFGFALSTILGHMKPRRAALLKQMNAVQMWRAGCKRSLLKHFNHIGICVGEKSLLGTIDVLKKSFEDRLKEWRKELERHVFQMSESSSDEENSVSSSQEKSSSSSVLTQHSSEAIESSSEDREDLDADEWQDVVSDNEIEDDLDDTILYGDDTVPKGYTLCWDNVGKQVKVRHQTRNHGNRYESWALAFAVKNRVTTTFFDNTDVRRATDIPLESFSVTRNEEELVRDRMSNMVSRILVENVPALQPLENVVDYHISHPFSAPSRLKSEVFNIGIISENPSSIPGVIKIVEKLHDYVPQNGDLVHPLILWGDGLSCERHADAQRLRENASTPVGRLEGLEPAPQEFHKRMILMQDTMDKFFDGKSACDKGTLSYLKNLFNQRSVSKHVSDSFNYVSEFLKFVTEGYVVLFAMDVLAMDNLTDELFDDIGTTFSDKKQFLSKLAQDIVDRIWEPIPQWTAEDANETQQMSTDYDYCFCKQDLEDDDEPMLKCENDDCDNGLWFHLECVGLSEEELPSGSWFCSDVCRKNTEKYSFCVCKTYKKGEPMIMCDNASCPDKWFHGKCIGLKEQHFPNEGEPWYCSQKCRRRDKSTPQKSTEKEDLKFLYTKELVRSGLKDLIRNDAVRENDGEMMAIFWKEDLIQFFINNHTKYVILGHRYLSGINGWLPERLRQDLLWNRTVNIRGGLGNNLETDLVNEFLNKEFKESIKSLGSKLTQDSLDRHGKMAGGVGKVLDKLYGELVDAQHRHQKKTKKKNKDMQLFVNILKKENLTKSIPGRHHKAYSNFKIKNVNNQKLRQKIKMLSTRLDKRRNTVIR